MISRRISFINSTVVVVANMNEAKRAFSTQTQKLLSWKAPNLGVGVKKQQQPPTTTTSATTTNSTKKSGSHPLNSSSRTTKNANNNSTNTNTTTTPPSWSERFNEWRKQTSVKKLVLIHGPVFGTWYFILNTCIQLAMASMLHYNLAGNIIESRELAVKVGMEERFDAYANKTYYLLRTPLAVNGRFIANYVVVATMMAPVIPVKISWTLASYPFVLKLIPLKWRPVWRGNIKA